MTKIFRIGLLAVLTVTVLAFTGFAYAESTGVDVTDFLTGNYPNGIEGQMQWGWMGSEGDCDGQLHDYMQEAWAELLGIDLEELLERLEAGETHYQIALDLGVVETREDFFALLQEVMALALSNAVEDGVITPEQAASMLAHMAQMGEGGMLGHMNSFGDMHLRGEGAPFGPLSYQTGLEEFLGMTREQVQERVRNGASFEDLLAEKGKTLEDWAAFSFQAHSERLNEAVANGQLTQEQADAMIQRMQERYENGWLEPIGPFGPFGVPGEGGGKFGMPGMHGPGDQSGPYGVPGEGGGMFGSPGMHGPGGHHGPAFTPPGSGGNGG